MTQIIGLLALHILCLYFLRLLWKDKNESLKRGGALTKLGYVSKRKSPRLFRFSIWVDFNILLVLYTLLVIYTIWFALQ